MSVNSTKDCVDPWHHVEFRSDGSVSPCCIREPVGNLKEAALAEILNGPRIRTLRRQLLLGQLDGVCRACHLKRSIEPVQLQPIVRAMLAKVVLPQGFDPKAYLEVNPDVSKAGKDAKAHFIERGRIEGRRLNARTEA